MQAPPELLASLNPEDQTVVQAWWESLSDQDRDDLVLLMTDEEGLPTYPIELQDERDSGCLDDDDDRYEYLVNHEHRPAGVTLGTPGIALPAISLLAPLWPPYPAAVRYRAWAPTDTLRCQLRLELDRFYRGHPDRRSCETAFHTTGEQRRF